MAVWVGIVKGTSTDMGIKKKEKATREK